MEAYLMFKTSLNLSLLPLTIALRKETIIKISKTENDALGIKVYKGNRLSESPEFSVKKLAGYNDIMMKKANQK
jgi:hypothetical protein